MFPNGAVPNFHSIGTLQSSILDIPISEVPDSHLYDSPVEGMFCVPDWCGFQFPLNFTMSLCKMK